jgi:glycosyltransferase involved in cell wall biosynthesis
VSGAIPIAFYAPLKSPNHPSPSGDRTMARLLFKALQAAGFAPILASERRTLDLTGNPAAQEEIRLGSEAEAERLVAAYRALPRDRRPQLWFTYHVYYKAPDWIGPRVADALGLPYAIAEGSRAPKRASGPWSLGHQGAEAALDRADVLFVMTAKDRVALARKQKPNQALVDLPPFLDDGEWSEPGGWEVRMRSDAPPKGAQPPHLLTVAMMRQGDKLASFRILAEALDRVREQAWTLIIVGDGQARAEVEALFAPFGRRVAFLGQVDDRARLRACYSAADLFLWPAVNEAYGMVLLEAQALGCPVVAGAYGGVASVVEDGRTGLLTPPGDAAAFAAAVGALLDSPERRAAMSAAARRFVQEERGLAQAAHRLRQGLGPLLGGALR